MRKLTLRNCQVDQAGEVSYQALNAITSAMLNVKGRKLLLVPGLKFMRSTDIRTGPSEEPRFYKGLRLGSFCSMMVSQLVPVNTCLVQSGVPADVYVLSVVNVWW